uniref:RRM domain-containing protein n=3 Tax=Meloidogyne TaxID=189290 RepID=A0A915MU61_MELJA
MSTLPKLVPNSLYSLSNLHVSSTAPFSAPPVENSNKKQETDRIFFGESFNETQPYFSNNNSPIGSVSDFSNLMNLRSFPPLSSELPPPLSAPPFHSCTNGGFTGIRGGGSAGCSSGNSGMVQGGGTGTRFRFTNRPTTQPVYFSLKVFLGGIQASLTTNVLQLNFAKFGSNFIDWPKKTTIQDRPPNGYAFVVFENEHSIIHMLRHCQQSNNRIFFPVYTLNGLMHPVEIKVWQMSDTTYAAQPDWRKLRRFSVFVGGIPRTCTAATLAYAIEDVIGPVAYCAIELDPNHFYPKGAACVVFSTKESYIKAIAAHEVILSFGSFERKVELKAFLASNMPCEKCGITNGTRFCNEIICLAYYCVNCWKMVHVRPSMSSHTPSKRHVKGGGSGESPTQS